MKQSVKITVFGLHEAPHAESTEFDLRYGQTIGDLIYTIHNTYPHLSNCTLSNVHGKVLPPGLSIRGNLELHIN